MAKDSAEQPKKSRFNFKTILITILVINLLAAVGAAGYFFYLKPAQIEAAAHPKMLSQDLGSMLVNLADDGGTRFIRFTAVMEFPESEKDLTSELSDKKAIIEHTVIGLMRTKKMTDVQPPDSIEKIQREMTNAINKQLEKGKITRIYFTEYLTQ